MEIAIIPQFIIKKYFSDEINQMHANVLMTHMLIIIVLLFWHTGYVYTLAIPHFCIFQKILNIPCPGCGVMRSLFAIAGGNILSAWKYNPAGLFLFPSFLVQLPLRIIALRFHASGVRISQISRFGGKIVISVLFLVWVIRLTQ